MLKQDAVASGDRKSLKNRLVCHIRMGRPVVRILFQTEHDICGIVIVCFYRFWIIRFLTLAAVGFSINGYRWAFRSVRLIRRCDLTASGKDCSHYSQKQKKRQKSFHTVYAELEFRFPFLLSNCHSTYQFIIMKWKNQPLMDIWIGQNRKSP